MQIKNLKNFIFKNKYNKNKTYILTKKFNSKKLNLFLIIKYDN